MHNLDGLRLHEHTRTFVHVQTRQYIFGWCILTIHCIYRSWPYAQLPSACGTDLQEPADCLLVLSSHGHHILIEPEQWPVLASSRLHIAQDTEKLKEQSTSPF